ncbi:MAG: hypothetical protein WC516_05140 [Patescibacteria group bacterium]|jgi:hypothetical protein
MSKISRTYADEAGKEFKKAKDHAKITKEYLKSAGDSEGEKHAAVVEKVADEGEKYVQKRLGSPQKGS